MNRFILLFALVVFWSSCSGQVEHMEVDSFHYIELNSPEEAKAFYTWSSDRIPMVSAHRGGPYPGFPENAIETFDHVLIFTPAIIEFDVELTRDSVLVLMHDSSVDRTTNGTGKVADYSLEEIRNLFLVDQEGELTNFRVPTLTEALEWSKGKALLTVDVKKNVPFEMVVAEIEQTGTVPNAAVITYNFSDAQKVYGLNPDLMLSVTIRNEEEIARFEDTGIPWDNVIAFTGLSERSPEFNSLLHQRGVFTILGVLGNLDKMAMARGDSMYKKFIENGADILATDRPIEAARVINTAAEFRRK